MSARGSSLHLIGLKQDAERGVDGIAVLVEAVDIHGQIALASASSHAGGIPVSVGSHQNAGRAEIFHARDRYRVEAGLLLFGDRQPARVESVVVRGQSCNSRQRSYYDGASSVKFAWRDASGFFSMVSRCM